jgi:hypothetical protein
MAVVRKSLHSRKGQEERCTVGAAPMAAPDAAQQQGLHADSEDAAPEAEGHQAVRAKRLRQGVEQFPMQILVPEETREALRQRSEDTGASIRHIILRSLAADGFPVPRLTRRRD